MRNIKHRTKEQKKEAYNTSPKSGLKQDIIDWLIHTDFVDNYAQKLIFKTHYKDKDKDDIIQDIWMIILEIEQDRWDTIYNQGTLHIIQYISGLIYRQISSTSSQIFKKYKDYREHYYFMTDNIWSIYEKTNTLPDEARQTEED